MNLAQRALRKARRVLHGPVDNPAEDVGVRQARLELAMRQSPGDFSIRQAYLELMGSLHSAGTGLIRLEFPELAHPIHLRCRTSDWYNYVQIFCEREFDVDFGPPPRRILDLGGYIGMTAVWFAQRYPEAEIVCVEPSEANYRLLQLNTLGYPQIRTICGAVWSSSRALGRAGHAMGDWGARFDSDAEAAGDVQGWSIEDLLEAHGWPAADFIKCDIEGGEREVFSDPSASWLSGINVATAEIHDQMAPGAGAAVRACFPAAEFEESANGELVIFRRRRPEAPAPAAVIPLIRSGPFEAADIRGVSEALGLLVFAGGSVQLQPNREGPPPEVIFSRRLDGQRRFVCALALPEGHSPPVAFTVKVLDAAGAVVRRGEQVVQPLGSGEFDLGGEPLSGEVSVSLSTAFAGEGTGHGYAQWLEPRFLA